MEGVTFSFSLGIMGKQIMVGVQYIASSKPQFRLQFVYMNSKLLIICFVKATCTSATEGHRPSAIQAIQIAQLILHLGDGT